VKSDEVESRVGAERGWCLHRYVPSLPDCISESDTIEEALANIREAIELYFEPVEDDWVLAEDSGKPD